ncbi:hypothetical protein ABKA04_008771 [Annulohypoxylon sp. FPYF3050]
MDYIPLPLSSPRHLVTVPFLSRTPYDDTIEFADYPEYQGWGKRPISNWYDIFDHPTRKFQAFLQRWLLFAPLQAFTGSESNTIIPELFHPLPEPDVLTLRTLPQIAERWLNCPIDEFLRRIESSKIFLSVLEIHQLLSSPDPGERVDDCTGTKHYTLQEFLRAPGRKDPCHPDVSIAISAMLDFCRSTVLYACSRGIGQVLPDSVRLGHSGVFQWRSQIWMKLINQGWCPFELTPMSVRFNTAGLVFMSHVERPIASRNHETSGGMNLPHQDPPPCSSFGCVHRRLNDATYSTAHVPGCCGCPTILAQLDQIAKILEAGSFPLIVSVDDTDGSEHIQLVPWKSGVKFVAISHVWSDGLGNVRENGIPKCQLHRLSKFTRDLPTDTSFFWLDTICVPPDAICQPPEATRERKLQSLAISKMRNTYEYSTAVLVLDAWLFSNSSAGMTDAEKMMRVFSCTWNSRLWTYQEGALSKTLYFQFKDTAESLDEMKTRLEIAMETDIALKFTLGERLVNQYHSLRGFRQFDSTSEDFFLFIMQNMAFRSTSVATDEALCLSTLMGLDMDEILEAEPEQRMAAFWRKVPCAPSSLLIASVPTLDDVGLSWAPRSCLLTNERLSETGSLNTLPSISLRRPTRLTDDGLMVDGPGLLIRCDGYRPEGDFLVEDDLGFKYHVKTLLHKDIATNAFREAVAVLVVHGHDRIHHCTDSDGALQPLLLMQPHRDNMMIGRKIGTAVVRCLTPNQDWDLLQYSSMRVIGDPITQKLQFGMGRNVESETWCVV